MKFFLLFFYLLLLFQKLFLLSLLGFNLLFSYLLFLLLILIIRVKYPSHELMNLVEMFRIHEFLEKLMSRRMTKLLGVLSSTKSSFTMKPFHILIVRFLDLQKGMIVYLALFTLFTEVEIWAFRAFVSYPNDGEGVATITSYIRMYHLFIFYNRRRVKLL